MLFKHSHDYRIVSRSNTIQYDDMGYPLRLCLCKCGKCGKTTQEWIDTIKEEGDVVLKWEGEKDG